MRSSVDGQPDPHGRGGTANNNHNNNNNNNNSSSESSGNSGSQYALCALGVGLVALGIVMIVWSVVPSDSVGNSSSSTGGGDGDYGGRKNKASSVAFVLVGSGVVMLLLSLCLGMRNKQREQMRLLEAQSSRLATIAQEERENAEEQAQRYAVPTYEEAVCSGQYPVRQSNLRPSSSQLPSYDDLVQVDGVQYEFEGPEVPPAGAQPAPSPSAPSAAAAAAAAAPTSTSNHRPGKNTRKLLPIKIRRIKSEKIHMKNIDNSQPAPVMSIEPLTPPPQYDDELPPL